MKPNPAHDIDRYEKTPDPLTVSPGTRAALAQMGDDAFAALADENPAEAAALAWLGIRALAMAILRPAEAQAAFDIVRAAERAALAPYEGRR